MRPHPPTTRPALNREKSGHAMPATSALWSALVSSSADSALASFSVSFTLAWSSIWYPPPLHHPTGLFFSFYGMSENCSFNGFSVTYYLFCMSTFKLLLVLSND